MSVLSLAISANHEVFRGSCAGERTKRIHLVASERCRNFLRSANALSPNDLRRVTTRFSGQNPKILERQSVLLSELNQRTFKTKEINSRQRLAVSPQPERKASTKIHPSLPTPCSVPPATRPLLPARTRSRTTRPCRSALPTCRTIGIGSTCR
jgi:hypothetical protein